MDPENNNTQVDTAGSVSPPVNPPVVSEPQNVPSVAVDGGVPASGQSAVQESGPPVGEKSRGSSILIKIAIWILVAALLAVIAYVVYANLTPVEPTPTPYIQPVVTQAPLPMESDTPAIMTEPPSSASASPVALPLESPTGSPSAAPEPF